MQNNRCMLILEPENETNNYLACLYLERSPFGIVGLFNLYNYYNDVNLKLVLTDQEGYSHIEKVTSSCYMFKLTNSFYVGGDCFALVYEDNTLILSGEVHPSKTNASFYKYSFNLPQVEYDDSEENQKDNWFNYQPDNLSELISSDFNSKAKEWAEETNQINLYNEATKIIERVKRGEFSNTTINNNCNYDDDLNIEQIEEQNDVYNEKYNNKETMSDITECKIEKINCRKENLSNNNSFKENLEKDKINLEPNIEYVDSITYNQIIGEDFDYLFNLSTPYNFLNKIISNSHWRKLSLGNSIFYLCKIIKENQVTHYGLGVPILSQNSTNNILGKYAKFIKINALEDFGYLVLVQDAITGKAVKLNGNICWQLRLWCIKINK